MSSNPKRTSESGLAEELSSFIRPHDVDDIDFPPNRLSSAGALTAAVNECDDFLDRWLARHFSLSVKLHDVQRQSAAWEPLGTIEGINAILDELAVVQGVLIEL